jgi:hypothetical protein
MKHLEDEDIGRLIDGNIDKNEREIFLNHLSICNQCAAIYSETLKFIEEEKKIGSKFKIPGFEITWVTRFLHSFGEFFAGKRLQISFAVSLLILLSLFFLLIYHSPVKTTEYQVHVIEQNIEAIEKNSANYAFNSTTINIPVRWGIISEDISLIGSSREYRELLTRVKNTLINKLKYFSSPQERNTPGFFSLLQFGHSLERAVLSIDKNESDLRQSLLELKHAADTNRDRLPQGVFKELDKIEPNTGPDETKIILKNIKDIFLLSD